jgi:hypothetical protein
VSVVRVPAVGQTLKAQLGADGAIPRFSIVKNLLSPK